MLDPIELATSIRARLLTSADGYIRTNGVYINSAGRGVTPKENELPYVVLTVRGTKNDTQLSNGMTVSVTVFFYDHRANTMVPLSNLWKRIYGNGDPPSTGPTYGLQRFRPTLASGNEAGVMEFQDFDPAFEEDPDAIGWVSTWEIDLDYKPAEA
jgi:hypothetical protein